MSLYVFDSEAWRNNWRSLRLYSGARGCSFFGLRAHHGPSLAPPKMTG